MRVAGTLVGQGRQRLLPILFFKIRVVFTYDYILCNSAILILQVIYNPAGDTKVPELYRILLE
jgi:hypothetical protein